jgi:hypothetical protein
MISEVRAMTAAGVMATGVMAAPWNVGDDG